MTEELISEELRKDIEELGEGLDGTGGEVIIPEGMTLKDAGRRKKFLDQLYKQAMRPSATARHMELYARIMGILIDKPKEIKLKISADDIAKQNYAARRELEEQGYALSGGDKQRMVQVSS